MEPSTATSRAAPPCAAICGFTCWSSTAITRWARSPEISAFANGDGGGTELHEVREGAGLDAAHLHPQDQLFGLVLGGAHLQNLLEGLVGDGQQIAHAHHAMTPRRVFPG